MCGIAGPVGFVAGWLVNGARTTGYDPLTDAISQLAREGAPTRLSMTACFVVFGVLVPVWARTLSRLLGVPALQPVVTVAGLATLAVAALPLTRAGGQPQDTWHAVAATTGYLAMAATPLVASRGLRGAARGASVAVGVVAAAALVASTLGAFALGLGSGAFQRLGLTAVDAWHVAVASSVLLGRRPSLEDDSRQHRPGRTRG